MIAGSSSGIDCNTSLDTLSASARSLEVVELGHLAHFSDSMKQRPALEQVPTWNSAQQCERFARRLEGYRLLTLGGWHGPPYRTGWLVSHQTYFKNVWRPRKTRRPVLAADAQLAVIYSSQNKDTFSMTPYYSSLQNFRSRHQDRELQRRTLGTYVH